MNSIYTAGYAGHMPAHLKRAAAALGAYVVDIRYNPTSRAPGWSSKELQAYLGDDYLLCRALGNINHKNDDPMAIANLKHGLERLNDWAAQRPLILLCGCSDYGTCHRKHIADILIEAGHDVREIEWPVIEREGTIPCLSLWQPWASLIAVKAKTIETRGWATNYRGPLAIHAAKTTKEMRQCGEEFFLEALREADLVQWAEFLDGNPEEHLKQFVADLPMRELLEVFPLPLGAIVAIVDLVDCVSTDPPTGIELLRETTRQERAFGNFMPERFAWKLENVRRLKEPIPYRGAQKLFNVTLPVNLMRRIKA